MLSPGSLDFWSHSHNNMLAVRNKDTGRLVWRESPDFERGYGLGNAIIDGLGTYKNLEEVEVTQEEWDAEIALRQAEKPKTLADQVKGLSDRVSALETKTIL
jgi:hypothetical protein